MFNSLAACSNKVPSEEEWLDEHSNVDHSGPSRAIFFTFLYRASKIFSGDVEQGKQSESSK